MKEIIDAIKTELPQFFINFINILTKPKISLAELSQRRGKKDKILTKALVYFILCCLLTQVWQIPMYGHYSLSSPYNLGYSIFGPIIFLFLAALALRLAWRIVGFDKPYFDYLIIFAYHIGTLLCIYLFLNFINLSILKMDDENKFKQIIEFNYLKTSKLDPSSDVLTDGSYLLFSIIGLISLVMVLVWFYRSWSVYRTLNKASRGKGFLAVVVFTAMMVIVFFIDQAIGNVFKTS